MFKRNIESSLSAGLRVTPDIPKVVGSYTVIEKIKSAGNTRCFRARHEDGTEKILKLIETPETVVDFEEQQRALLREYAALRALGHTDRAARVESYFPFGREYAGMSRFRAIPLSPLAGLSLRADRQISEPDLAKIVSVMEDAFEGLGAIHQCGVVHRALTPDRVFVDARHHVRFSDFVAARIENQPSIRLQLSKVLADDEFRAPEYWHGQEWVGRHTDVYGLAATLHWWVLGKAVPPNAPRVLLPDDRMDIQGSARALLNSVFENCTEKDEGKRPKVPTVVSALRDLRGAISDHDCGKSSD